MATKSSIVFSQNTKLGMCSLGVAIFAFVGWALIFFDMLFFDGKVFSSHVRMYIDLPFSDYLFFVIALLAIILGTLGLRTTGRFYAKLGILLASIVCVWFIGFVGYVVLTFDIPF
jgi:hypothetical protein